MKRFFRLKNTESIIFTDDFESNIRYNKNYKIDGEASYQKNWFTYLYNPTNFYRKNGTLIEHIQLSNVKYSCGQEIESTETILGIYGIYNLEEITEELAREVLKNESLDFSDLYDKNMLGKI